MSRVRPAKHLALFALTFVTTTAHGAIYVHPAVADQSWWSRIPPFWDGLSYSLPLLLILLCHELAHYFVARAHGVDASLPYFIPLPPSWGLGTMGAVIGMRGITSDRKKLIDIGAAGPLAGLVVAVPVILYGLSLSPVGPLQPLSLQEGNSLLYAGLKFVAKGEWLPSARADVFLHPTALAGWAGLLVTMINLLPLGQLDGGHIATSFFGNRYGRFARVLHRVLPVVGLIVFAWCYAVLDREAAGRPGAVDLVLSLAILAASPWIVWFALVGVLGRLAGGADHPPVDEQPLPRSRRVLFWVVVAAFLLIFMPVPQRITLAGVVPNAPAAPGPSRP